MTRVAPALLAFSVLLLPTCGRDELILPEQPDLVLVTFSGLRADSVTSINGSGKDIHTPNLSRFLREASWVGRGVSSSSDRALALAGLWTGARPWELAFSCTPHLPPLRNEIPTLPEVLTQLGYRTVGLFSQPLHQPGSGFERGFGLYQKLRPTELPSILHERTEPVFLWLGLPEPRPPSRTGPDSYPDSRTPYDAGVTHADTLFGALLASLRSGGAWKDSVVVVTSDAGWPLGEVETHGAGLSRGEIEVPVAVLLPSPDFPSFTGQPNDTVATRRLFSTIVELAGGSAPAGAPPSLFHATSPGVLSELYCREGRNTVSYLENGRRVILERVLQPSPGSLERRADRRRWRRSDTASHPPLTSEAGPPLLRLEQWAQGKAVPIANPALASHLAQQLDRKWRELQETELSPERMMARETPLTVARDQQDR